MSEPTITVHHCEHGHVHVDVHRDDMKLYGLVLSLENAMALSEELANSVEAILEEGSENPGGSEEQKVEKPTMN